MSNVVVDQPLRLPPLGGMSRQPTQLHLAKTRSKLSQSSQSLPKMNLLARIPSRVRAPPLVVTQSITRDKTFITPTSATGRTLEQLYQDVVDISDDDKQEVMSQIDEFVNGIKHKISNNRYNLKFSEPHFDGPTYNGLATKHNYKNVDIYLIVALKDFKLKPTVQGYTCVAMTRNLSYDRWEALRSTSHKTFISPIKMYTAVHDIITHVCTSTGLGSVLPLHSGNSDFSEGTQQIMVLWNGLRINMIPTLVKTTKQAPDPTFIVPKPYIYDNDPMSDQVWRYTNPRQIKTLLNAMDRADRKTRTKSLRLLLLCYPLDSVLKACPAVCIVYTLLNMFDQDVDSLPSWQTVNLEKCFNNILSALHQNMVAARINNPFNEGMNLIANMPERTSDQLKRRLIRLVLNKRELLRLLQQGLSS